MENICDCEGTGELPVLFIEKQETNDGGLYEVLYQTCASCSCDASFKNIEIKDPKDKSQVKINRVKKYPNLGTYNGWRYDPRFLPIPERIDEPGCEGFTFAQRFIYTRTKWWKDNGHKVNVMIGKTLNEPVKSDKESLKAFLESEKRAQHIKDIIEGVVNV